MVTAGRLERFILGAEAAGAEVRRVGDVDEAAAVVAELLSAGKLDPVIASADVRPLIESRIPLITPRTPREFGRAAAGIVAADFGIAETGTLVHLDRDDEERMAWTLPEVCCALLSSSRIVETAADLAAAFTKHLSPTGAGSAQVSLVTGPSRTADIENELTIGVQGPARLVILLLDRESA